ncbi:MAG: DUF1549 and DUF1553 domain-containing protein [Acidobacteria bacterium]|nr:DUF1549 and DUF1553 domain-containing protein [Acidobacteriota bacterium]
MKSLLSALVLTAALAGAGTEQTFAPAYETRAELKPQGKIDELVFANWKQLGIRPAHLCSDAVFLRRAYLDAIGTLPTAQEAARFLADRNPDKRSALVDYLLERDEFAAYWAMKWSDLLRVKAEFPINLWPNAAQAYHHWIQASLSENKPYDRFVREMLTATGSNFRVPEVNFYRAMQSREPQAVAQTVALTFMGDAAEKWPKDRLAGMAAFFSGIGYKDTGEWKEEIVLFDPGKMKTAPAEAVFPDGTRVRLSADRDPRELFADWLISPKNPWFTRSIANRVWSWLLGRGIAQEPDDLRPGNPPSNPELLDYLERELIASRYDLKHLYRLILNSETYQLSSIPGSDSPEAVANFASYPLRRLDAEVLIDALCQITGTTETYSSAIPEPYTFIPPGERATSLPDGSITSSFLELFGRPPRDNGLESERNNRPSASQRLHLLNSSHIQRKIEQSPKLQYVFRNSKTQRNSATALYLMILSRMPTEQELKTVTGYSQSGVKGREAMVDLAWALINSAEFLYRH